ncbi:MULTISPECIES: hypothetical protein [unclassified Butyrivibrio]|uniref:hypothetical protein n=1 Tax=unclassified Butyrivibrio TaxID=2639466 RepID=UPI0003F6D052|nr:hypothetical protein [Butyrivibrio sp. LC3010]
MAGYDMDVNYDTLCSVEEKLEKIQFDLDNSTQKMADAIQRSQDFLAGNQYEKAKSITTRSIELTKRTHDNIGNARKYIGDLRMIMEEYGRCGYPGEA